MREVLPHASIVWITSTCTEKIDPKTRAIFGDDRSVYDIQRAVFDAATVPIYYESRLARLESKESERPKIDPEYDDSSREPVQRGRDEEVERKERLKSKRVQLEAVVDSESCTRLIARNLVEHLERRAEVM